MPAIITDCLLLDLGSFGEKYVFPRFFPIPPIIFPQVFPRAFPEPYPKSSILFPFLSGWRPFGHLRLRMPNRFFPKLGGHEPWIIWEDVILSPIFPRKDKKMNSMFKTDKMTKKVKFSYILRKYFWKLPYCERCTLVNFHLLSSTCMLSSGGCHLDFK